MSWGKIDPNALPDTVVCYRDATIALPLLTAYALGRHAPRPLRRLYRRREEMMATLRTAFEAARRGEGLSKRAPTDYHETLRESGPAEKASARKPHAGFRTHAAFGGKEKGKVAGKGADGEAVRRPSTRRQGARRAQLPDAVGTSR